MDAALAALLRETIDRQFAANPGLARSCGAHAWDGVLPPVGRDEIGRRVAELDGLALRLDAVDPGPLPPEERADLATARQQLADERFHLAVLRDPETDPRWAPSVGADVWSYASRRYAPAADRAEAVCRHLEQLPEWLAAAGDLLEPEVARGPREVALDIARGYATYYRRDLPGDFAGIPADLGARLGSAVEAGAAACERHASLLEARAAKADPALGAETFAAMLEAQEGVRETAPALRRRVDAELERLGGRAAEVAGQLGAGGVGEAFKSLEAERTTADQLIPTAAGMLDRLRDFWLERDVVTIPTEIGCTVTPSPAFYSFITAAYENPGALDPPGLPHFYFVTPVDTAWSPEQQRQWLSHLNLPSLENISVHEVFPGHFVHCVAALAQPSLVRKVAFGYAFGEGWAHYAELLAIEQGLAATRPAIELAMLQDALLRACRFSATVGMHTEGMSLADATRLFEERAHVPRLAAEREALRGTYDPMYLLYTYGKLEILRWREELGRRPGFDLKRFHDGLIGTGLTPLGVVRDLAYSTAT